MKENVHAQSIKTIFRSSTFNIKEPMLSVVKGGLQPIIPEWGLAVANQIMAFTVACMHLQTYHVCVDIQMKMMYIFIAYPRYIVQRNKLLKIVLNIGHLVRS